MAPKTLQMTAPTALPCPIADSSRPLALAVDDDEDSLLLLCRSLDIFGIPNLGTTNPVEALRLARSCNPSIILLDIVMPELSGLDLVQFLRRSPQMATTPIIAVTALARSEDQQILLESGCSNYLSKPYSIDDLQSLLSRYLNIPSA
jgi:CheY-like chemotaxis protein